MKTKLKSGLTGFLISLMIIAPPVSSAQSDEEIIHKYLGELTLVPAGNIQQKYRMTAVYTNRDLYGTFTGKTLITGDYTRGLENGLVSWNNVYISGSNDFTEPFPAGTRQEYMENITYVPSPKMLEGQTYKDFPPTAESVLARNLIWDMMAIEGFAWDHADSLELNKTYRILETGGEFEMGDIGNYAHTEIQLCWSGISAIDDALYAVIDFRALDNIVEISMESIKTRGTEQYWGTAWVSLETGLIGQAVMYGGTVQEIEVAGLDNKFVIKTIRELWVDKIM